MLLALFLSLLVQVHAADVVQNIHVLLLGFMHKPSKDSVGALCSSLTPLDVLSSIIASGVHDYKHTGTTNLFHTASVSDLAITYNDVSVLENMSVSETFELILRHKVNTAQQVETQQILRCCLSSSCSLAMRVACFLSPVLLF